jgi:hypothetical protein
MDGQDRRGFMQRVRHVIHAAMIGSAVVAFSTNPGATAPRREEHSRAAAAKAIDALDRCVQDRFVRIDKGFGMSRVSLAMHNTRVFVPVNESESRVVRDFETLGMRVILYVVSRQQPRFGPFGASGIPPLVQGPVLVSPTPQVVTRSPAGAPLEVRTDRQFLHGLPDAADLRAQGVQALNEPGVSDSRAFEIGEWSFVARPVRASAPACLSCHNSRGANGDARSSADEARDAFRLGDPLGAVLYGYQMVAGIP